MRKELRTWNLRNSSEISPAVNLKKHGWLIPPLHSIFAKEKIYIYKVNVLLLPSPVSRISKLRPTGRSLKADENLLFFFFAFYKTYKIIIDMQEVAKVVQVCSM